MQPLPLLIFPFTVPLDGAGKMRDPAQGIYARAMARAISDRLSSGGEINGSCATLTSQGAPGEVETIDPHENGWVVASQPWTLAEACAIPLPEGTEHLLHGSAELTDRVRLRLLLVDQPRAEVALDHIVLRPRVELFQALDEAAEVVSRALGRELPEQGWPTADVEAYVAYMRGRDMSAAHEAGVHVLEPSRSFDGYLEAVRRDPQFAEAQERLLALALDFALDGRGPLKAAQDACERLLVHAPGAHRAYAALAEIALSQGQPATAKAHLEHVLALRPDWTPAFPRLGAALLALGDPAHALVWLDASLRERPDDANALIGRGNALEKLGRSAEAVDAWTRALVLDGSRTELHDQLARALTALGRHADARPHLQKAALLTGKPRFILSAGLRALSAFVRRLTSPL